MNEYQLANQNLLNHYERINKNHSFLVNLLIRNTSPEASKIIKEYLEFLENEQ
jgi:uncharacterized protein with NRDE domain